jgi:hypothetical protein
MKKTHLIILIAVIVILIVGGLFFFGSKKSSQSNRQMPSEQNVTELSTDSLLVGNWVSIMAQKGSDGSYTAEMINVCESEESCQNNQPGQGQQSSGSGNSQTPPSGEAPTGAAPDGQTPTGSGTNTQKNTANRTMLSGTITEKGENSITISLDTGETTTVSISDSTRIVQR